MNAIIQESPVSFGLALKVLCGRRMEQVGQARRKLRELREEPTTSQQQIELAEAALEDARDAVTQSQRLSDAEARVILAAEGVTLCKE